MAEAQTKSPLKGINYGIRNPREFFKDTSRRDLFCVDQAKYNFAWLTHPALEEHGLSVLSDAFVEHVHERMDRATRSALYTLPLSFMRYWEGLHSDPSMMPTLASVLDEDYMATMTMQAHKAQARLVEKEGNVVKVPFGGR